MRIRGQCVAARATVSTSLALTAALLAVATRARADTILAPVGGRSVRLGPDRIVCPGQPGEGGWTVDADARGVHPPTVDTAIGHATVLTVAADASHCAASHTTVTLVAIGPRPSIDAASITVDVDAALVSVHGHALRGMEMRWWAAGGATGSDRCGEPQSDATGESCILAIGRSLPVDPQTVALSFAAPGVRVGPDIVEYDAQGRALAPPDVDLHPARVHITRLVAPDASIDVQAGVARIALTHPDAVSQVDCDDASCDLDGNDLVVRDVRSTDATLGVRFHLRPHVLLRRGAVFVPDPLVDVALQLCPVSVASPPPLRGVADQAVVLRIAGRCAHDADLRFSTASGAAPVVRSETSGDAVYAVVRPPRIDGDEVSVTVERNGTIVGVAHTATRALASIHSRLELRGRGEIDFIPTNREVRVLPPAGAGLRLAVIPVDGIYAVGHDTDGAETVRAVQGAAGAVALRFAWRDPSLPVALRELDLATISEPVDRAIHQANLPVALGARIHSRTPLIELLCGGGAGNSFAVAPGDSISVPYSAHESCRLVLHRERLALEEGAQNVRIVVEMLASDGTPRRESSTDQTTVFAPGAFAQFIYITGVTSRFDRAIVRVSLVAEPNFYAIPPDEHTTGPQAQWSIIFGNDRFRIYGTFAVPTGLFRISDQNDSGNLTLSAGILFRVVPLTREGVEFPLALEAGLMWLGILNPAVASATMTTLGGLGGPATVFGVGIGLPIANAGRVSQASISLHLWGIYDIWRPFVPTVPCVPACSPFGLVFGPSISIGNIGVGF